MTGRRTIDSVRFYFDPACPWTWITSRWLVEVAELRSIDINWETFSLRHRNRDNPGYDWIRDELNAQFPGLRVIEATRARYGNPAVGRLYTAFGTLIHHDRDDNLTRLAEGIELAGVDLSVLGEAGNAAWDTSIVESTETGMSLIGDDGGIPLIVIPGNQAILFGPVLAPAPTGPAAVELWDAFVTLGRFDGLYEIKRTRHTRPTFGPRPRALRALVAALRS